MNFLGSATFVVAGLLAVIGIGPSGSMARAGETYDMTTLYEKGAVTAVMFSPDGKRRLIALPDGSVRIRDNASGDEIALLKGDGRVVYFAAFSPDGARLVTLAANISASPDTTVRVWDISGGREIATQKKHLRSLLRRLQPRRRADRHGCSRRHLAHLGGEQRP